MRLIRKISKSGRKVYLLLTDEGDRLYASSPTYRDYVAILFEEGKDGKFFPVNRFGRLNLIGKGDSKHLITEGGIPLRPKLALFHLS